MFLVTVHQKEPNGLACGVTGRATRRPVGSRAVIAHAKSSHLMVALGDVRTSSSYAADHSPTVSRSPTPIVVVKGQSLS